MKSESIKELTAALSKAHLDFKPIKRTEEVDYQTTKGRKKYSYAPLSEVIEATKKALSDNGLAVTQFTTLIDGNTILVTLLSHNSGEWISGESYVGKQDQPPQEEGSALTYKRRYGLSAILNVSSEEDDDGTTAQESKEKPNLETSPQIPDGITEAQSRKLYVTAKEKALTPGQMKAYIETKFNKLSSKDLTKNEASQLIEDLIADNIKEVQLAKSRLVEEVKRLGAVEETAKGG